MIDNRDKSIYERLEGIETQNSNVESNTKELLNVLGSIKKQLNNSYAQKSVSPILEQDTLRRFIQGAKAEHFWFGTQPEFNKKKMILIAFCLASIIAGVISTIFTSLAANLYTTFSFFENISAFASLFILLHAVKFKRRILDFELMENSCEIYSRNSYGKWFSTECEKKRYKWFRRIACVAVVTNIAYITISKVSTISIFAIIFEIIFFGLIITVSILRDRFEMNYSIFVFYTGRNLSNTETVTIVWNVFEKKLLSYEVFANIYKGILE